VIFPFMFSQIAHSSLDCNAMLIALHLFGIMYYSLFKALFIG
jgi:ABC-type anion transport system duplicated permease subunit